MAISKEQIFAVADELDAAGQNPTLAGLVNLTPYWRSESW